MKVPPLDLKAQFEGIREDVQQRVEEVFQSQGFILGPLAQELETQIAALCEVKHGIGVASGSDALLLSLMALGIGEGDAVITTPFSFFSTVSAITRLGAEAIFVDIDPVTCNLNPDLLNNITQPNVRAILPVHLYGQLANMEDINRWAWERDIDVVEDAAQAIGASRNGRPAGNWGTLSAFSFYPTKNLGGAGDGGMIVTDDDDLAEKLRSLRDHGARQRYYHDEVGINSRLDALQAAVLLSKLPHLESWNQKRREIADQYREALQDLPIELPVEEEGNHHIYHQFVIRTDRRDELKAFLDEKGIFSAIFYPVPLHLQNCFEFLGYHEGDLLEAEKAVKEVLALPIFPELGEERFGMVVDAVREFFLESRS
ncbi:transcriptional regulator [candidate division LCP-89 bacterium B3_LCP]|uniref:Transcriptional regulator n=1 Tax=candidate division LCP-89 bacterium B3_LCP TaxID=2012998 RepID=A0A532V510_UNCL8|nr:MAG: transcriptional regulator [candidate division LCP-89 bacterium B3_LCP]